MRYFDHHFVNQSQVTGEVVLVFGIAGGRVNFEPCAKYLYSLRLMILWWKFELLWLTKENEQCLAELQQ